MVCPSLYSVNMDRLATPHVLDATSGAIGRAHGRRRDFTIRPLKTWSLRPRRSTRYSHRFDAVERARSSRVIVYCLARTNSRTTRVLLNMLDQTIQVHTAHGGRRHANLTQSQVRDGGQCVHTGRTPRASPRRYASCACPSPTGAAATAATERGGAAAVAAAEARAESGEGRDAIRGTAAAALRSGGRGR